MRSIRSVGFVAFWGVVIFSTICGTWLVSVGHFPPSNMLWTYAWVYFLSVGFLAYVAIDGDVEYWQEKRKEQIRETNETAENVRKILSRIDDIEAKLLNKD